MEPHIANLLNLFADRDRQMAERPYEPSPAELFDQLQARVRAERAAAIAAEKAARDAAIVAADEANPMAGALDALLTLTGLSDQPYQRDARRDAAARVRRCIDAVRARQ